jgi:Big-like domain-containing protein/WD40 repeat protein
MRRATACALLLGVAWVGGCQDETAVGPNGTGGSDGSAGPIVSDPKPAPSARVASRSVSGATGTDVVYVSLQPGTVPNGGLATIRNTRTGGSVSVAMSDGGFDPVRMDAQAGDTLAVQVELTGGGAQTLRLAVPATRPPVVVRTDPPPGKRDVPLNARIVVVFSEPINPGTVGGIRLLHGAAPTAGQTTLSADGLRAEFQPAGLLAANAGFALSIPSDITDLSGDRLPQPVTAEFATGSSVIAASVATAQPALITTPFSGDLRTFVMSAIRQNDGRVSGSFSIFYPSTGVRVFGRVTCFTIVGGNAAWIAGVVEGANDTTAIGHEDGWRAVDNGPPGSAVPDQLSLADPLTSDTLGNAQAFCAKTPATSDLGLNNLVSGDIVVNGSGPPPPPTERMSEIAFAVWPNGGIQVINADGTSGRVLTSDSGDFSPAWSPDGTKLAFDRYDHGQFARDIYVMGADGSGLRRLTSDPSDDSDPTWSPDGSEIAFGRDGAIYAMNANDGSGVHALTTGGYDSHPTWSSDGLRIAFASSRSGVNAIYAMNADGTGVRQLTSDPAGDYTPWFSPDGRRIAFQRGESGVGAIYLINLDGTGLTQLTLFGRTPSWSPDGRVIVFEQYGLTVVNVDGSGMMRRGIGFDPAWSSVGTMPQMPQPYASISIAGGNGQTGRALTTLPQPLTVHVSRDDRAPAPGVHISWYLPNGGLPSGPSLSSYGSVTDASGQASVSLTLGAAAPQEIKLRAAITDGTGRTPGVEFTATAVP